MRKDFPLFQSHLDMAHGYWKRAILPGDIAIDATCGNGQDSLVLAQLPVSKLIACDKQPAAIQNTKELLKEYNNIVYWQGCHSQFPDSIDNESVRLIVYNLGYLPGGDKSITTKTETTLTSVKHAIELLQPNGVISITCYPGHAEGKKEEEILLNYAATLNPRQWNCCYHQWLNRHLSPSLLLLQKSKP